MFGFKNNSEKRKLHQQHKHDMSADCSNVHYIIIKPNFVQQRRNSVIQIDNY